MLKNADVSQAGHAVVMAHIPDPEVAPRAQPRTFAPSYKARILAKFEALPKAEWARFLRREGLYSTLIRKRQAQAARTGDAGLVDRRPRPHAGDPAVKEIARLKSQVTRLQSAIALNSHSQADASTNAITAEWLAASAVTGGPLVAKLYGSWIGDPTCTASFNDSSRTVKTKLIRVSRLS